MLWICFPLFLCWVNPLSRMFTSQYLSFPFMFLCFYYIWIHKQYIAYFSHFNTLYTWSIILCIILQLASPPPPQIGISLVHFYQTTVSYCISSLLFSSHLEECVTNNIVMNILGHIPPGNRLTFLENIHQEATVWSSYKALTWLEGPRWRSKMLVPTHTPTSGRGEAWLLCGLIDTWYSQVLNFLLSRWVAS